MLKNQDLKRLSFNFNSSREEYEFRKALIIEFNKCQLIKSYITMIKSINPYLSINISKFIIYSKFKTISFLLHGRILNFTNSIFYKNVIYHTISNLNINNVIFLNNLHGCLNSNTPVFVANLNSEYTIIYNTKKEILGLHGLFGQT